MKSRGRRIHRLPVVRLAKSEAAGCTKRNEALTLVIGFGGAASDLVIA